jgi:hypothetical protein
MRLVPKHCYLKKQIGKNPSESKKEIMEITKDKLFSAIADLVNLVMEHSNDSSEIVYILKQYGFTNEQIAEWYALDTGE